LGHPAAEDAIASLLGDSDWQVRADAAEAAGRISLLSLIYALSDLLADDNWLVRFRAGEALAVLGPEGLASLRRLVLSQADVPRRMAGLILAERGLA
jgi:HEAT repeat protein